MKHLLRIIGALALTAGTVSAVVACESNDASKDAVDLATVLKKKDLQTIFVTDDKKPKEEEVKYSLNRVNDKKINLNSISITVKQEATAVNNWTGTVKPDGKLYKGKSIEIKFITANKKEMTADIVKNDLGFLDTKEPKKIREELFNINKKLDKDSVEIGTITEKDSKVNVKLIPTAEGIYKTGDEVTFVLQKDLATVLTERNLGDLPSKEEKIIREGIEAKNNNIDKTAIDIKTPIEKNPNSFTAKVTPKENSIYKGNSPIEVNFIVKSTVETLFDDKDLGDLPSKEEKAIWDGLKAKVDEKYKNSMNSENISINNIKPTSKTDDLHYKVEISATDTGIFTGKVDLTYTVKPAVQKTELKVVITETALGNIERSNDQTIYDGIRFINQNNKG